jgi:hypothetical protein
MKKLLLFIFALVYCTIITAQKKQAPGKGHKINKVHKKTNKKPSNKKPETDAFWEGTGDGDGGGPKPSRNQPAKVRSAFQEDYPTAANVSWHKYRGDWTATFGNGAVTSTAVYHANGQRKDTRTVVSRPQVPKVILDDILKRKPRVQLSDIVKIEAPQVVKDIFRIRTIEGGTSRYLFYDAGGMEVKYNY